MNTWLAALMAAAAIALTYVFCVRTMMRGCSRQPKSGANEQKITELSEELRVLRTLRSPRQPPLR
jgi:hypothetical protein